MVWTILFICMFCPSIVYSVSWTEGFMSNDALLWSQSTRFHCLLFMRFTVVTTRSSLNLQRCSSGTLLSLLSSLPRYLLCTITQFATATLFFRKPLFGLRLTALWKFFPLLLACDYFLLWVGSRSINEETFWKSWLTTRNAWTSLGCGRLFSITLDGESEMGSARQTFVLHGILICFSESP